MRRFKWWVFGVLALFLVWRIVAVNVSQHLDATGNAAALQWKRDTPRVLLSKARAMAQTDPDAARALALEAVLQNPANGRGYILLAALWEQAAKPLLAKQAAEMANLLEPRNADVQLALGNFWVQRGQPVQAVAHWGAALESRPALAKQLFPVMLSIVDTPALRLSAAQALQDAPAWWSSFFMYALNNAVHEATLKALYSVRTDQAGHAERRAYLDHLIGAGLYTDAYFVWLNGLQPGQIAALGNVYDGGFEQALDDEGFGWRPQAVDGLLLSAEPTYGNTGSNALHVAFQQRLTSRELLRQFLMLDAGEYRLKGKFRLDNLTAGKGVRWDVSCSDRDGNALLVSTEHFIGTDGWNKFEAEFNVPAEQCEVQSLRLQLNAGNDFDETAFSGSAWFDELEIEKK